MLAPIAPAIEISSHGSLPSWFPPPVGFVSGGLVLYLIDQVLPHLHLFAEVEEAERVPTQLRRRVLLVLAITLHNVPEGLAVGVAFGGVVAGVPATGRSAVAAKVGGVHRSALPWRR